MKNWFENKTIALVGSAESFFDSSQSYGEEIEQHEVVVRCNKGIVIRNEEKQGSRTDIWAIGKPRGVTPLFEFTKTQEKIYLTKSQMDHEHFTMRKDIDPKKVIGYVTSYKHTIHLSRKGREKHPRIETYIPMKVLEKLMTELGHRNPSSGLMIAYYIMTCAPKKLDVYAFDWKKTPTWYYEQKANQPHDWEKEKNFFKNNISCNNFVEIKQ